MPDDVTIGELARRMDALDRRMTTGFEGVTRQITAMNVVHTDRYDADRRADERRLQGIEDRYEEQVATTKKLWWVIVAQLIGLIAEAVFFLAIARGGG